MCIRDRFKTYGVACGADLVVGIQKNVGEGFAGCASTQGGVCFVAGKYPEALVHESSHSIFSLADEYVYSSDLGGCTYQDMGREINCDNTASCPKWSGVAGTSCVKGCTCSNNYRPADTCVMNSPWETGAFCPVCTKTISNYFK